MLYFLFTFAALASPVWSEREAASATLLHLIDRHPAVYGPRLAEWAKDATEPEVRSRCRIPLACYYRWRLASYVPRTVPVYPCIDFAPIPTQWGDVRYKGLAPCWMCWAAPQSPLDVAPYWNRYRKATERMVRGMLMDGAEPTDVDMLLGRMWALEQAGRSDCGDKFAESAGWTTWQGGFPMPRSEP